MHNGQLDVNGSAQSGIMIKVRDRSKEGIAKKVAAEKRALEDPDNNEDADLVLSPFKVRFWVLSALSGAFWRILTLYSVVMVCLGLLKVRWPPEFVKIVR